MRTVNTALKSILLILIVSVCVNNLWRIAAGYQNQEFVRSEMQNYVSRRQNEQRANGMQSDKAAGAKETVAVHYVEESGGLLFEEGLNIEPEQSSVKTANQFIVDMQNEINPDIIAWLSIPGTEIDYPVARAADNDFYLQHDIYGNEAVSGSLFIDYRNPGNFSGFSTIIHGHNMKNRSMFGTLRFYSNPDYLYENKYGFLYTSTETYMIEIFAYMVIHYDDPQIYANPPSADEFIEYVKENARIWYDPDGDITKVLLLSTCAYDFDGARTVLLASMKELS